MKPWPEIKKERRRRILGFLGAMAVFFFATLFYILSIIIAHDSFLRHTKTLGILVIFFLVFLSLLFKEWDDSRSGKWLP